MVEFKRAVMPLQRPLMTLIGDTSEVNKELRTIGAGLQSIDGHLITFVQAQE